MREEVAQEYQRLVEGSFFEHDVELLNWSDEDAALQQREEDEVRRNLESYLTKGETLSELLSRALHRDESVPEAVQELALELFARRIRAERRDELLAHEAAIRSAVEFVLDGLTKRDDKLYVKYTNIWEYGDKVSHIPCVDDISDVIGYHPDIKGKGEALAAEAAYRVARLLTPEVLELVLSDDSREEPVKRSVFDRIADPTQPEKGITDD